MRITKFFIASLLSIFVSTTLYAQENTSVENKRDYEPLVREDRIWEYGNTGSERLIPVIFRMKFDGIKEIKGREYNILKIIYVRKWEYECIDGFKILSDIVDENSANYPEFYMREENGIVYGIYEENNSPYSWYDYTLNKNIAFDDNEFILYNFYGEENEEYESVAHCGKVVGVCKYKIISKDIIENHDKKFKSHYISYPIFEPQDKDLWASTQIVEGIGPLRNACLPYLKTDWFMDRYDRTENDLIYVYDLKGNIIFEGKDSYFYNKLTDSSPLKVYSSPNTLEYKEKSILVSGIANSTLTVTDTSGRQVLNRAVQSGDRIDVSELPAGIYIATLSNGSAVKICIN